MTKKEHEAEGNTPLSLMDALRIAKDAMDAAAKAWDSADDGVMYEAARQAWLAAHKVHNEATNAVKLSKI